MRNWWRMCGDGEEGEVEVGGGSIGSNGRDGIQRLEGGADLRLWSTAGWDHWIAPGGVWGQGLSD